MDEYKIEFEDFDKSKIKGTYTRLHYGNLKIAKLKFSFVVYEVYMSESNYMSFSMNFTDAKPDKSDQYKNKVIEQTKVKLNLNK